jgi:DNA-binding NarL/FixJ family response regulator
VRVIVADDHPESLATAIRCLESEFEVVKAVGDGQAAVDETGRLHPDLVVLDIGMPGMNGFEAARRLTAVGSPAKIVFLTVHCDADYVRAALAAGATAYVDKCRLASDLVVAAREALAGRSFVSSSISLEAD